MSGYAESSPHTELRAKFAHVRLNPICVGLVVFEADLVRRMLFEKKKIITAVLVDAVTSCEKALLAILNLRLKPGRRCIELHYGTFGVNFDPFPVAA